MSNSRPSPQKRRRQRALRTGLCYLASDFNAMCRRHPDRIGILAEGDSWFSYPRKYFAFGDDINLIHHIGAQIQSTDTANLIQLASNGDEAVEMTSGRQFKSLYKLIKKNRDHIKLILFSGGGNDIVGKDDMLPLLNEYTDGMSAMDCIRMDRLERKIQAISLAYQRLLDLCQDLVPQATVITHTYDIAKPAPDGAEFIWGLIETKPWIHPYMTRRRIPEHLQLPIIEYLLKAFAAELKRIAALPDRSGHFIVVDTQGTLRPGHRQDWLNEIHPTESGFKRIARQLYAVMRDKQPGLPAW